MFTNYLKIAWRNLLKNKVFSFINILGLTIGITVCMMIYLFIMNEFSEDGFHTNGKNIYRVMRSYDASKEPTSYLSGPYAPALLNDFGSDIKAAVRVNPSNNLFVVGSQSFNEKKVYITDSNFFTIFSFPLLRGNALNALKDPHSIVLTRSTARRYFGSIDNAMGKVIEMDKNLRLKVTGVAEDVPSNSHMNFDMVVPIANFTHNPGFDVWINNRLFVYVALNTNTDVARLQQQFVPFMNKYMGDDMKRYSMHFTLSLTPLKNIYFESASEFDGVRHGDKTVVYIFISVAALIMLIACINFMNLSTIRAVERSKEVGLRKVMGALRGHLAWQFIGESVLLTAVSCILSVILLLLLLPWYNSLLGYQLSVSWNTVPLYLFIICIIVIVGFLSGSYPAFFLSAFSPVQALKGKLRLGKGASTFRQALVVVQFSISVFLIVCTLVIVNQMSYVKNKQLGYDKAQTVIVPIDNQDIYDNRVVFKQQLQNQPAVSSVSLMSGEPGGFFDVHAFQVQGMPDAWRARTEFADFEFAKTLGLKIIAGRDFSPQYATDSTDAVIINRTAAAQLGVTPNQAIGKTIKNPVRDSLPRRIVGVVEDFNFLSLKENMSPLVISTAEDRRVVLVKLKPGSVQAGIAAIKTVYNQVAPMYPFEYSFLDQQFNDMYKKDLQQQTILGVFAALAILVACLGLFGLTSFTVTKRIKEIGVRKVLGSSVQNIVMLLSKDLLKPVLLATCIALPLGYYFMDKWLQNFAYKTSLSAWLFLLSATITFGIALLTVSMKAVKAALANPIRSLRTE